MRRRRGGASRRPAARLGTKRAFGTGSAAESLALYTVTSFALIFYDQVLSVPRTGLVAVYFYSRFGITRARYETIQAALARRRTT
jgi:hypothetical protein